MAYELQAAKVTQQLREEEMKIKLVERQQQILIQEQEIIRKEKELDATVRRPAEAEKYKYKWKSIFNVHILRYFLRRSGLNSWLQRMQNELFCKPKLYPKPLV